MKKISLLFLMVLAYSIGFAQNAEQVVRSFTGINDSSRYVRLDSVVINKTSGNSSPFRAKLVWPDTTLTFTTMPVDTATSISENGNTEGFQLFQNSPNPFNGSTTVNLNLPESGRMSLEVYDMFGRTVAGTSFEAVMTVGTHQFRIHLAHTGAFVLTARQNGRVSSIKMINRGVESSNRIEFVSSTSSTPCLQFKTEIRGISTDTLTFGDVLEYVGYSTVHFSVFGATGYDSIIESHPIIDTLDSLQLVRMDTLLFDCIEQLPEVKTAAIARITTNSAVFGGKVTADGGTPVTERGLCWSKFPNPTIEDTLATVVSIDSAGLGEYYSPITGLGEDTTYYVRAYAINYMGTAYGEEIFFKTWKMCDTVMDIDSNIYSAIQIGNQCWMKENLRTTRYADSTVIPMGTVTSSVKAYRYYPNDDEGNVQIYGYLYNWKAVMGDSIEGENAQGICPTGWHIPSDAEWMALRNYVSARPELYFGNDPGNIAKPLASNTGWNNSVSVFSIGKEMDLNNATGFTALPAGMNNTGASSLFGQYAIFWSSSESSNTKAYSHSMFFSQPTMTRSSNNKYYGLSIRCVRD